MLLFCGVLDKLLCAQKRADTETLCAFAQRQTKASKRNKCLQVILIHYRWTLCLFLTRAIHSNIKIVIIFTTRFSTLNLRIYSYRQNLSIKRLFSFYVLR